MTLEQDLFARDADLTPDARAAGERMREERDSLAREVSLSLSHSLSLSLSSSLPLSLSPSLPLSLSPSLTLSRAASERMREERDALSREVQGYITYKKTHPPRTLP